MRINKICPKICPKILPFVKIRNKNDLPSVCVVSVTVCYCLLASGAIWKPFWRVLII